MLTNATKNEQKTSREFTCEKCYYSTSRIANYNRHLQTRKHNADFMLPKTSRNEQIFYFCKTCNKRYKHKQSYYRHQQKCISNHKNVQNVQNVQKYGYIENSELANIIKTQSYQIAELTNIIKDVIPKIGTTVTNNNVIVNKMSINVYLNETCKDAMNLSEFLDQIRITDSDLKYTKDNGYIKGMTNIFEKNLSKIDKKQHPFHCSDKKRLQFYIKDDDTWDKDKELKKIRRSLSIITDKNIRHLQQWKLKNPTWVDDDDLHDEFINITRSILRGSLDVVGEKAKNKVIKNIADKYTIDKDVMIS